MDERHSGIQPTNLDTLDELLGGGVPFGSLVLTAGPPGAGKTILAQQWLFAGARQSDEVGVYISFTEDMDKLTRNVKSFEFYDKSLVDSGKVHFIDGQILLKSISLEQKPSLSHIEMDQLLTVLMNLVDQTQAKRVVIDSVTALIYKLEGTDTVRNFIFRLGYLLSRPNTTIMLVGESSRNASVLIPVEEYIADGIIFLDTRAGANQQMRRLEVKKMRGVNYRSGPAYFEITGEGLTIYPKIPTYDVTALTDFKVRRKIGIPKLDEMMGGGIPQGHILLIGGNTGSGKTTFSMQFLEEGIKHGEAGLYVSLEESMTQIIKTAKEHDWMFDQHLKDKTLSNVSSDLIDVYPDRLLYKIVRTVEDQDIKRVVIDSISSMELSSFAKEYVREFLLQLVSFLKSRGINALLTYLTSDMFGANQNQLLGGTEQTELRLSSIVDGMILLRYVERDQEVHKLLSVLKMRGSDHEKGIYEFQVDQAGIIMGDKFKA
jgi:circadian clock protein KaiC